MEISEEIFKEFLKELEKDKEFPKLIIEELKNLWKSEEVISKEKILGAIKRGCEDVSED